MTDSIDPKTAQTAQPSQSEQTQKPLAEYVLRPNGIHEFTLKEYGMTGADDIMNQLEGLYKPRKATLTDPPLRLLVINGPGSLPISYSMQRAKELNNKYPNVGLIRMALISDNAFEARLVDSFVRLMH